MRPCAFQSCQPLWKVSPKKEGMSLISANCGCHGNVPWAIVKRIPNWSYPKNLVKISMLGCEIFLLQKRQKVTAVKHKPAGLQPVKCSITFTCSCCCCCWWFAVSCACCCGCWTSAGTAAEGLAGGRFAGGAAGRRCCAGDGFDFFGFCLTRSDERRPVVFK